MNLHLQSKSNTKVHKFLALFWYACILRLTISTLVLCKECRPACFPFNSWLSFQRLCCLLWGLQGSGAGDGANGILQHKTNFKANVPVDVCDKSVVTFLNFEQNVKNVKPTVQYV